MPRTMAARARSSSSCCPLTPETAQKGVTEDEMEAQRRGLRGVAFLVAALLATAVVVALLVLLATQASHETLEDAAIPLLAAALVASLSALLGWRQERRDALRTAA